MGVELFFPPDIGMRDEGRVRDGEKVFAVDPRAKGNLLPPPVEKGEDEKGR